MPKNTKICKSFENKRLNSTNTTSSLILQNRKSEKYNLILKASLMFRQEIVSTNFHQEAFLMTLKKKKKTA